MDFLLTSKLIDLKNPEKSLLLTKPLGTVKHGGGIKFVVGDQGYKAMRTWIDDVVAIKTGRYTRADDLPPSTTDRKAFGTDIWLKLGNTPDAWGDKLLQVNVYAWDSHTQSWEKDPIATTDRTVWGKGKLWQHTLTLLAKSDSTRAKQWNQSRPSLPAGKYLIKIYVDQSRKTQADWKATLGTDDYVGECEIQARWREGYNAMTVIEGKTVKK